MSRQPAPANRFADLRHFPQARMDWANDGGWMPDSQTLLNCGHATDAIVFVHGWGGDASGTWEFFPQAVATMPEAAAADAFFLDYPSTTSQVAFCANQLRRFVIDIVRDPMQQIVNRSLPHGVSRRAANDRYRRVFVVAHSMGAVIARRAVLDLDEPADDAFSDAEFATVRLLFFAPAHSGSNVPLLIGSGLGLDFLPGAKLVGSVARVWFQSLVDLEVGSPALEKLADDCRALRENRTRQRVPVAHLRASVYHAHGDRVVSQNTFDQDPPFVPVMKQNHRSVCKPTAQYATPIDALRTILS